jgi:hypothetical protein
VRRLPAGFAIAYRPRVDYPCPMEPAAILAVALALLLAAGAAARELAARAPGGDGGGPDCGGWGQP